MCILMCIVSGLRSRGRNPETAFGRDRGARLCESVARVLTMSPLPPGPRSPKVVQALQFGRDPTGFLDRCAARYGDTFTLRMPQGPPRVVVSDPESVRRVFALRTDGYRSDELPLPVNVGERSLIFQDGERHRRQRCRSPS